MVAKQKILPGDVLVVEPAFSTSLFREFYSSHCLHCFQRLTENPVCCPGCPTVGFCFIYKNYRNQQENLLSLSFRKPLT